MAKSVRLLVDDAATVTVTGGVEYEREENTVDPSSFNRDQIVTKLGLGITKLSDDDWWAARTASERAEILRRGVLWLARQALGRLESEGPPEL